jgi:hypothetical protein
MDDNLYFTACELLCRLQDDEGTLPRDVREAVEPLEKALASWSETRGRSLVMERYMLDGQIRECGQKLTEMKARYEDLSRGIPKHIAMCRIQEAEEGKFDAPHWNDEITPRMTLPLDAAHFVDLLEADGGWVYVCDLLDDATHRPVVRLFRRVIDVVWDYQA